MKTQRREIQIRRKIKDKALKCLKLSRTSADEKKIPFSASSLGSSRDEPTLERSYFMI